MFSGVIDEKLLCVLANFSRRRTSPRRRPPPAPDPRISTPEDPQIWPIDRSPMSTEVIDVGTKPKSTIFSHVSTALAEEKAAGGRNLEIEVFEDRPSIWAPG
jgi:hypothetical protein